MLIYNYIKDKMLRKKTSQKIDLENLIQNWENFVCQFFEWDSYYVFPDYEKFYGKQNYSGNFKNLFSEKANNLFDIILYPKELRLVKKNLEPVFA